MADAFSTKPSSDNECIGWDEWNRKYVLGNEDINKGPKKIVTSITGELKEIPESSVCAVFAGCAFMRQGGDKNHGSCGSNAITGIPQFFGDITELLFPTVHQKRQLGTILEGLTDVYVIPLADLNKYPEMEVVMRQCCANIVALQSGGLAIDEKHCGNALPCLLAATMFHLSSSLTITDNEQDNKKIYFLVNLYCELLQVTKSTVSVFSDSVAIMKAVPFLAQSRDSFQSSILASIFDIKLSLPIIVSQVANSIRRHFHKTGFDTKFFKNIPVGLVGVLLIEPMINSMMNEESEEPESMVDLVNRIITRLNEAFNSISSEIQRQSNIGVTDSHTLNKIMLRCFVTSSDNKRVSPEIIGDIYDKVVERVSDIPVSLGIAEYLPWQNNCLNITLNNKPYDSKVVIGTINSPNKAKFIPGKAQEWTGLPLQVNPGDEIVFTINPLGIAQVTDIDNSQGKLNVVNLRCCAGTDLMGIGSSIYGMIFDPKTKKYVKATHVDKISHRASIIIRKYDSKIEYLQDDRVKFTIETKVQPLIAFKNCTIDVEYKPNAFDLEETRSDRAVVGGGGQVSKIIRETVPVFTNINKLSIPK